MLYLKETNQRRLAFSPTHPFIGADTPSIYVKSAHRDIHSHFPNDGKYIFRVLKQIYIPHVKNVPRLDPPIYMPQFTHYILKKLTQIYKPHVPNLPNILRLALPTHLYAPTRPVYILRVLTEMYIATSQTTANIYSECSNRYTYPTSETSWTIQD